MHTCQRTLQQPLSAWCFQFAGSGLEQPLLAERVAPIGHDAAAGSARLGSGGGPCAQPDACKNKSKQTFDDIQCGSRLISSLDGFDRVDSLDKDSAALSTCLLQSCCRRSLGRWLVVAGNVRLWAWGEARRVLLHVRKTC
jgi:hypothetical protein